MFSKIIFCSAIIALVYAECDPTKCAHPPKHYSEMGCEPVFHKESCCVNVFNCPDLTKLDNTKCHFKGTPFNVGDKIPDEGTTKLCSAGCYCDGHGTTPSIRCAQIECPSLFNSELRNCAQEKTLDSCCASKYICDAEEIKVLPKCYFEGREYLKGASIYPESESCHKCICEANFDNSTVIGNPHCQEIECGIALRSIEKIRRGCIPVYYGTDRCCPNEWRCPDSNDTMDPAPASSRSAEDDSDPVLTCEFGSLKLKLQDVIHSTDNCVECKCTFPPMAHCIRKLNC